MKRVILFLFALLVSAGLLTVPMHAYAFDLFGNACGTGGGDSAVCQGKGKGTTNPLTGSNGLLITIANLVAVVAGIVAVFVIVLAGWRYVTSGGDPNKIESAKSALIYAVVGLVVIGAADIIIGTVLSHV